MYELNYTGQFKKDYKKLRKQGADMSLLIEVLHQLEATGQVSEEHRPHVLSGDWAGFWECHVGPDWLLIYDSSESVRIVRLIRSGSHSNLFGSKKKR
ncbi:MAG: type II toxin-antitoxin system YafQ family toxin [Bacteroidaceae bacterium]|nr:type II toxin-antitoxin system YafQ family toxin [Bacteroidaceae bacterium]